MEAASLLGSSPETLSAALALVRQRDADIVSTLQAFAKGGKRDGDEEGQPGPMGAGFDLTAFQAVVDRALALGLKGDVAAAKHMIERRRTALLPQMQRRGPQAGAEEVLGEP